MGFIRGKRTDKKEETANINEEVVNEQADMDDFSADEEKEVPTREEFKQAASENIKNAVEEKLNKEEEDEIAEVTESTKSEDFFDDEDDFDGEDDFGSFTDVEVDGVSDDIDEDRQLEEEKVIKKKFKLSKKLLKGICIGVGAAVGVCACVYIYGCSTVPADTIMKNVYIEGVDVSGLTFNEAVLKLQNEKLLGEQKITIKCKGEEFTISGTEVGLVAKIEETVDKAMRYGKTGNVFIDGFANTLQVFAPHTVIPDANADEAILREKISEFGKKIHGELVEHKLELGDGVVIAKPGHTGFDNNTDAAYNEIVNAIGNEKFDNIEVELNTAGPKPLTVEQVDGTAYCDPIDAYYHISGNDIMVIKEVTGRYINKDEAANLITQVQEGGPVVNIPYYVSAAAVTAEQLQAKLFNATLASYSTSYGGSDSNRRANISNAASKINGKILAPGEVFSFNQTVGPRSVANGFKPGKEYSNGEVVDGIGGGTCQVSSTLYNAVLYSDLGIVSRTNHMFPVSYCPLGQDATVADSGIDFKFVNNTDYPVKIVTSISGATITISIVGTQRDVPRTVKIENSSTAVGADTSVTSVRYVYDQAGNLLRKENIPKSYYLSH